MARFGTPVTNTDQVRAFAKEAESLMVELINAGTSKGRVAMISALFLARALQGLERCARTGPLSA
jgi:hypothetical protein